MPNTPPPLDLILLSGPDRLSFLQGQITQDTRELRAETATLGALLSAQGRVIAILWLIPSSDVIALAVHHSLTARVHAHLARCVLRAKVSLARATLDVSRSQAIANRLGDASLTHPLMQGDKRLWTHALIKAGIPEITESTCERWIPQMLNLDLLDAISFNKGCYTGQEIVARTQHLGRIKRRLMRFSAQAELTPEPLAALLNGSEKVGEIVNAIVIDQRLSLCAVLPLDCIAPLTLEDGTGLHADLLPYPVTA